MSTERTNGKSSLVRMITPPSPIDSLLINAETNLRVRIPSIETLPPLTKIPRPDKNVVELMGRYADRFPGILAEASSRARTNLVTNWDATILEAGTLNLTKVFTFVIIRLFEVGELRIEAEDFEGSELVDWGNGCIAVITGAHRIKMSGTGKLIGSCVSYEMPAPPKS